MSCRGVKRTVEPPSMENRQAAAPEVPEEYAEGYREAYLVIADSPKASAALSRRCLQNILREKAQVKHPDNLADARKEVVEDPATPKGIADSLDAVRNIGNFAAHPNKSQLTGEIVEVEPLEAEWCLEILFAYYFVRPTDIQRRQDAINSKLVDIGKPELRVGLSPSTD